MDTDPGTDAPQSRTPGMLEKFHLGLAADGTSCAMVFIDDRHRSIACIASFTDLNGFIVSLTRAAAEMARRRVVEDEPVADVDTAAPAALQDDLAGAINITASDFRLCGDNGHILGALVGDGGQVISIRLRPDVANEMTRNMLRTAPVASAC